MTEVFKNVVNRRRVDQGKALLLRVQMMCQMVKFSQAFSPELQRETALSLKLLSSDLFQAGVTADKAAQEMEHMANEAEKQVNRGQDGAT